MQISSFHDVLEVHEAVLTSCSFDLIIALDFNMTKKMKQGIAWISNTSSSTIDYERSEHWKVLTIVDRSNKSNEGGTVRAWSCGF